MSDRPDTPLERPARWFHSFELPSGERIEGDRPLSVLREEAELIFDGHLTGRSVLDIGAWDGYFSFEAERRGAADVLATDHFCWSGQGWGTKAGFDYVHHVTRSRVRSCDIDVADLSPDRVGTFDTVLLLGVLYHVKNPYGCLEIAASLCRDHLVIETETALEYEEAPAMRLFLPGELYGDHTNFWAPNTNALRAMLANFGFAQLEVRHSPSFRNAGRRQNSFRARAREWLTRVGLEHPLPNRGRGRVIVHARR